MVIVMMMTMVVVVEGVHIHHNRLINNYITFNRRTAANSAEAKNTSAPFPNWFGKYTERLTQFSCKSPLTTHNTYINHISTKAIREVNDDYMYDDGYDDGIMMMIYDDVDDKRWC